MKARELTRSIIICTAILGPSTPQSFAAPAREATAVDTTIAQSTIIDRTSMSTVNGSYASLLKAISSDTNGERLEIRHSENDLNAEIKNARQLLLRDYDQQADSIS